MIIVIDDFWVSGSVSIQKKSVANKYNAAFIPLDPIKGKEEFMCGIGTNIFDSEGKKHIVEHEGVAKHPNDAAMKFIADSILQCVKHILCKNNIKESYT